MTGGATATAIDVAIVNWNTAEAALAAAGSFLASDRVVAAVTIVDNDSAADDRRALEEALPDGVTLDLADSNLGYGRAANRALAAGRGEMVCVSNADVRPEPAALAELAAVAAADPRAGMVGPALEGDDDIYHAELPRPVGLLGQIFAGSFMRKPVPSPEPGVVRKVGQPSGACFLMRRETWERVGGFDDGFFLWYEDVDLAKRLEEAGFHNLLVGSARVGHAAARSFNQLDRPTMQSIRGPSLRRYIEKHHRRLAPVAAPLFRISGNG
jgi:N-acetylglucosaminyl-diphospho-decaprenol L-rhamnosyltransferase